MQVPIKNHETAGLFLSNINQARIHARTGSLYFQLWYRYFYVEKLVLHNRTIAKGEFFYIYQIPVFIKHKYEKIRFPVGNLKERKSSKIYYRQYLFLLPTFFTNLFKLETHFKMCKFFILTLWYILFYSILFSLYKYNYFYS